MATQRGFRREILLQDHQKEDTYNTDPATGTWYQHNVSSEPFNLESDLVEDTDLITGYEEGTALAELSRRIQGSLTFPRVKPASLAFVVAYAFGSNATDADTLGNSGAEWTAGQGDFSHIMVPSTDVFELPSFCINEDLIPGTLQYIYTGCMINSFTLSTSRKGWWELTAEVIGSGSRTTDTETGTETDEPSLKAGDATVYAASSATGHDAVLLQGSESLTGTPISSFTSKVVDFSWTFSNNIPEDDLYHFASGKVKGRAERGRRTQSLSVTLEFEDATYLDYLTNGTQIALEVDCVASIIGTASKYYGFDLAFPILQCRSVQVGGGTDKMTAQLDLAVLQDATLGSVEIEIYNKATAKYATT